MLRKKSIFTDAARRVKCARFFFFFCVQLQRQPRGIPETKIRNRGARFVYHRDSFFFALFFGPVWNSLQFAAKFTSASVHREKFKYFPSLSVVLNFTVRFIYGDACVYVRLLFRDFSINFDCITMCRQKNI